MVKLEAGSIVEWPGDVDHRAGADGCAGPFNATLYFFEGPIEEFMVKYKAHESLQDAVVGFEGVLQLNAI